MEDLRAQSLIRQMVHNSELQAACALPFDEAELWQGQGGPMSWRFLLTWLFCESQEHTAQALGICLHLLENNKSSDSVRK